jgi:hypothetical protein
MRPKTGTTFSGIMAIFSLALVFILVRIGLSIKFTEGDYWIGYLGLGLLLDVSYLSVHFLLRTLLFDKPHLARACGQIVAAIVALPLTILAGLLSWLIVRAMAVTGEEVFEYSIDLSFVILLLACPAFLLWRYALKAPKGEPDSGTQGTRKSAVLSSSKAAARR